ncbi:calcium/calmodulin-dependent serine/threonine-protein kinase-like [Hibiscus syriacus]|uniref:calcium/calmodulin-dependent serine/threonine-protein kinase-like n=1 Tax=Hibiscus syriacus TaxID=106335 RepID=UPI001921B4F7|nr:calcium/calmodulin-dependent serine/threonine-protein kinase-like [Hibiscus syriacus]
MTPYQVSISDAFLTIEIPMMRKIIENILSHPNVIDLHDVYEDQTGVHLVLELCSRDLTLKIMDFGLSSVDEFMDLVIGLFGSINYVSPEAFSQGEITTKSDI